MEGHDSDNEKNDNFNPEEEIKIESGTQALLPEVEVKTGEENEDLIFKIRARIFRLREKEWKERGTGDLKLLRNNEEKKIRLILRQDKTLKVAANFLISEDPLCLIESYQNSDKMFKFNAYDFSEEEPRFEAFVIKLGNAERIF
jgi:Ran-binding protein 1